MIVGLTGVLVAAVAYDASGLRADLARCERPPDSLELLGCGLTRLSAGVGMLGLAILIVLLLALGGWLIAVRSSEPESRCCWVAKP